MEENSKIELAILKERLQALQDQLKRLISHVDSEQRVSTNISKRVDQLEFQSNNIFEAIEKHNKILLNEGKGLSMRIDRMEQSAIGKRYRLTVWFGTISILLSLIAAGVSIMGLLQQASF